MEAVKSGSKKRVLPTWMMTQVAEKSMVSVKTPRRRRMAAVPTVAAARWGNCAGSWGSRRQGGRGSAGAGVSSVLAGQ
nr:cell cycle regulator of non-homologous end joining-like [Manis javanica]XP_017534201.2 cell cycle regulator of non-homologous end joining-like [Manis javanica]XP_036875334.1 cell cycle regulator of non-homologous end joining-like [Manis javanica]XP_036875335.1 cell cycle regulator of non-homologous end joining-like [Manis javanica]XP_036875336.1 cell cycle regulator of non-homologous end joining-like [Manis javanica]XP_036875337.1 cell cycle regulator of non-homologous end joining-like [Man